MMKHQVLVRLGVGKLKSASFQSPKETCPIQKDTVDCEPSLVFRWSFGTVWLLLNLNSPQSCGESNNVAHSLDDPETTHKEER